MNFALPLLSLPDQVLGDTFGFNVAFPYNINGHKLTLTLKANPSLQTDAQADAQVVALPFGVSPDANGNYAVLLAVQTTTLTTGKTYYFDIVDNDQDGNIEHIIDPQSAVNFKQSNTQTP